jgi:hypothetical protein
MYIKLLALPLFFTLIIDSMYLSPAEHHVTGFIIPLVVSACDTTDTIPELNQKIVELVRQQIGTTVGRGECWDLAALVLNKFHAKWDGQYVYGRKVDPDKECVFPGDLVQFEGVMVKYTRGNAVFTETMEHHTAVINEVKAPGVFVLAHQNTGTSGRKVGLSELDLKSVVKGTCQFFRPEF